MLGKNILKYRKKLGLSQEELSEKLNVTRQTISNWELDETQPNSDQLKTLSKLFNISIDELVDNDISSALEKKVDKNYKVTKILIRLAVIFFVLTIIHFGFDTWYNRYHLKKDVYEKEMTCTLNDENYIITMRTDNYFKCVNCPDELMTKLRDEYFEYTEFAKVSEISNSILQNIMVLVR